MLNDKEQEYVYHNGYVPEHVTAYIEALTGGEAFLDNDYLCYSVHDQLFFVGYPLQQPFEEETMMDALNASVEKFKPEVVALVAPHATIMEEKCHQSEKDHYFRLSLSGLTVKQKNRNMIHRSSKELTVEIGQEITEEHWGLISEFFSSHSVDKKRMFIFENIPKYISAVSTVKVFNAVDKQGRLAAFDIVEFGSKKYAFYMFNFRSKERSVPGASDLLLNEIIQAAKNQGKSFVNLGLGMNQGNIYFKEKWGGKPFLDYAYCHYSMGRRESLLSLLMKFKAC